jgi:quercetin 2,3-dioxygenase
VIKIKSVEQMGHNQYDWLDTLYHFSFNDYYDPSNMNFGVLRVLNDDIIKEGNGFPMHPHRDMEIISYVIDGELTHGDNMGNQSTLTRGEVQYMSAGTSVIHSESNESDQTTRILQLWILPDKRGLKPAYGEHRFTFDDRVNHWLHMVSSKQGDAPIKINQDANLYSLYLESGKEINFELKVGRQAYLVQIEGNSQINHHELKTKEAAMIVDEGFTIKTDGDSHFILVEMAKQ